MKSPKPDRFFRSALVACCGCVPAAFATQYTVTNLGSTTGVGTYSINNYGQIAAQHPAGGAFVWNPVSPGATTGTIFDLGTGPTGATKLSPTAINSYGQVVGYENLSDGDVTHAFLWTPQSPRGAIGTMTSLPPVVAGQNYSAFDINDSGQVVGTGKIDVLDARGFLWTPDAPNATTGSAITIDPLGTAFSSTAYAINASGQLTGVSGQGYIWTPSTPNANTGSGATLGVERTLPQAIDTNGDIAGYLTDSNGIGHPFLWKPAAPNESTGSLSLLDAGTTPMAAYGMNNLRAVVGYSSTPSGDRAWIWTETDGLIQLNSLPGVSDSGWNLKYAYDINDLGEIVGYGTYDPDGPGPSPALTRGYLLTASVPEPTTSAALTLLLTLATATRRHRTRN